MKRSLRSNRSGIVWVWVACLVAIVLYSIVWFAMGMASSVFFEAMTSIYTFPAPMNLTAAAILSVIAVNPMLMLGGLILWAYVNSGRREDVTYPQ